MLEKLKNDKFSELALYFLFHSYDKKSLEEFLKEYNLENFIEYYDEFNNLILDENELLNYFDGNYEKISRELALFFAPFLPEDFVINKDLEKLRLKLVLVYGNEISDAIVKALEILSMLSYPKDLKEKEYLLKEVFKIMLLLSKIMKLLKE
ncbi:hypothetical protein [Nautilia lithotrophica]